jgi:hypothetical protein
MLRYRINPQIIDFPEIFILAINYSLERREKWWNFPYRFFKCNLYVLQSDLNRASQELYPNNKYALTNIQDFNVFWNQSLLFIYNDFYNNFYNDF